MSFDKIPKIEPYDMFLDVAFSKAAKRASILRSSKKSKGDRLAKSKLIEVARISTVNDSLCNRLLDTLKSFPSIKDLHPFYQELIKTTLDYPELKKSLGALNWAVKKCNFFKNEYVRKVQQSSDIKIMNNHRKIYYGRVSSVLKQIKKNLVYLEGARKEMRKYPGIKTGTPTVVIFGFPNVGKTTLLSKLTGSKPEIASYAFTTKGINVGFMKVNNKKIQVLDTPGTLDRFDKMNNIEKVAYLALKMLADMVVYVFDPTEPYPMKQQRQLFDKVKKVRKPLVYWSKSDLVETDKAVSVEELKSKIKKLV